MRHTGRFFEQDQGTQRELDLRIGRQGELADVATRRPLPERFPVHNGTEFTSKALDAWASWNKLKLDFSRSGRRGDNAHIEAFNSLVRECLSQHWFRSLEEAVEAKPKLANRVNQKRGEEPAFLCRSILHSFLLWFLIPKACRKWLGWTTPFTEQPCEH